MARRSSSPAASIRWLYQSIASSSSCSETTARCLSLVSGRRSSDASWNDALPLATLPPRCRRSMPRGESYPGARLLLRLPSADDERSPGGSDRIRRAAPVGATHVGIYEAPDPVGG